MPLILLTGGARAGKSRLASSLAERSGDAVSIVATAEARDEEMLARITEHQAARPATWNVIEEPLELVAAFEQVPNSDCLIVDCLTLWVSNLLEAGHDDDAVATQASDAAATAQGRAGTTVAVTNEVGWGIVPGDPLSRRYRDLLGEVNSIWAAAAKHSYLVVAGRALELEESP